METLNRDDGRLATVLDLRTAMRGGADTHEPCTTDDGAERRRGAGAQFELDADVRAHERILGPGASGAGATGYRMLRTQVLSRLDRIGANTLAVLGAGAGVGKSLTALNLAIAIAADPGRSALLVDFDLRGSVLRDRLRLPDTLPGIDDCLEGRCALQDAMVKLRGYERLTLLPARSRHEAASELLATARVAALIGEMRERYANRVVVFDLPPVLLTDDALVLSRHLQSGLMVVAEGRTCRDDVLRSLELLRELPIVGTVLNASRTERTARY